MFENLLNQFVSDVQKFYELSGQTPERGWESAHHPVPKCLKGVECVWLRPEHHAIHGVIQSLVYDRKCFFNDGRKYLEGYWSWLLPVYDYYVSQHARKNGLKVGGVPFKYQSEGGRKGGLIRSQQESFRQHCVNMGKKSGSAHVESGHMLRLRKMLTGAGWWVNNLGDTCRSKECPGPGWQRGRKWKAHV